MASTQHLASQVQDGWYDAVVRIDLFTDVYDWNKGWKMALSANYDKVLENCAAIRVAPIGVFNVGKTWLIKKLCRGANLLEKASGEDVHTEGLSIKVSRLPGESERLTCFLDTAGLNSPVTSVRALGHMLGVTDSDPMKAMDNMLQELKRHENFIRQVAFEFAQVYLLVVGQISHRDQLELLQLIQLAEKYGMKKQVIVVHNLKKMTYQDFTSEAKYDSFAPDAKPISYRSAIQNVYQLAVQQVLIQPGRTIDVLHSTFGDGDRAVQIRHVFLTRDVVASPNSGEKPDPECKNDLVLEYLRTLIQSVVPITSNILADIAKIATTCARSMVHLPHGKTVEIRFHPGRRCLVAGEVKEEEIKAMETLKSTVTNAPVVHEAEAEAKRLKDLLDENPMATQAVRDEFDKAEETLSDARVKAVVDAKKPKFDATTLVPLPSNARVTCRPVALGATTVMSGDGHVKYNVSRVRAMAMGQPHWMVCVHLSIPGLAPGELKKLRETLRWDEGLTMAAETPQAVDTLRLQFTARIVPMPLKQLDSLNRHGVSQMAAGAKSLGAIRIDATQAPAVIEAGNRPFPTPAATLGAAKEALDERNGSYALDVLVHTKVENCSWEIEPILSYSRGVLTVMVCAEPSEDDCEAPENQTWISGESPAPEFKVLAGADGSDEDGTAEQDASR